MRRILVPIALIFCIALGSIAGYIKEPWSKPTSERSIRAGLPNISPATSASLVESAAGDEDSAQLDIVLKISDRGLQTHVLTDLARQRALTDPEETSVWLLGLPDCLDRADAFAQLGHVWAENNPLLAANFALQLPPGALRQSGLTATLTVWMARDPSAATAWFDQLDAHPDFDGVAKLVATIPALIEYRPEVALSWAESIVNDDDRKQRIGAITGVWLSRDRLAAANYLEHTTALTSFQRETLIDDLGL